METPEQTTAADAADIEHHIRLSAEARLRREHVLSLERQSGSTGWSCSCGARSTASGSHRTERQARAAADRHLTGAFRRSLAEIRTRASEHTPAVGETVLRAATRRLRATHSIEVEHLPGDLAWSCTCGARSRSSSGYKTAEQILAAADRHLRAFLFRFMDEEERGRADDSDLAARQYPAPAATWRS